MREGKPRLWILTFCRKLLGSSPIYIKGLYMNLLYVSCTLGFPSPEHTESSEHMTLGVFTSSRALTYKQLCVPPGLQEDKWQWDSSCITNALCQLLCLPALLTCCTEQPGRGLTLPAQSAQCQCPIHLTCREITAFHFSYESICITVCFQMCCLTVNNKH